MIVCFCRGVGAGRIRTVIAAGADSVDAVALACGAGAKCGGCREQVRALVAAAGDGAPASEVGYCRARTPHTSALAPTWTHRRP